MANIEVLTGDIRPGTYQFFNFSRSTLEMNMTYSEPGKFMPQTSKVNISKDLKSVEMLDQELGGKKAVKFAAVLHDGRQFQAMTDLKTWQTLSQYMFDVVKNPAIQEQVRSGKTKISAKQAIIGGVIVLGLFAWIGAASNSSGASSGSASSNTAQSSDSQSDTDQPVGLYITKGDGYPLAVDQASLDKAQTYVSQGDKAALGDLMNEGAIDTLPGGKKVFVMKHAGFLGQNVEIREKGSDQSMGWTTMDALKSP